MDLTHTHTHTHLTPLCPALPRWAVTRKVKLIWISLKQETASGSGISWALFVDINVGYLITGFAAMFTSRNFHWFDCFVTSVICYAVKAVTCITWQRCWWSLHAGLHWSNHWSQIRKLPRSETGRYWRKWHGTSSFFCESVNFQCSYFNVSK